MNSALARRTEKSSTKKKQIVPLHAAFPLKHFIDLAFCCAFPSPSICLRPFILLHSFNMAGLRSSNEWAPAISPDLVSLDERSQVYPKNQAEPRLVTHYGPSQSWQVEVARLQQPVFHCSLCCRWPLCVSSARDKFHHWFKISLTFFLELFGSITFQLQFFFSRYLKHLIINLHLKFALMFDQGHAPKLHLCLCTRSSKYKEVKGEFAEFIYQACQDYWWLHPWFITLAEAE